MGFKSRHHTHAVGSRKNATLDRQPGVDHLVPNTANKLQHHANPNAVMRLQQLGMGREKQLGSNQLLHST